MKKDLWKRIAAVLAVVLLLIVWAVWSYNGYIPGMTVKQPIAEDVTSENKDVIRMRYYHYLFRTAAGGVAYVRLERISGESEERVAESYTFPNRICTHFRMLGFVSEMEYREMAAALGAPHSVSYGSGMEGDLIYKTVDGYQYRIPMNNGKCGKSMRVIAPDGRAYSVEDTAALQQQVRAFYVGILAGALPAFAVAFVCLRMIPKAMENRKAKTAEHLPKE